MRLDGIDRQMSMLGWMFLGAAALEEEGTTLNWYVASMFGLWERGVVMSSGL